MRERYDKNTIKVLMRDDGNIINKDILIEEEILGFYHGLMGTTVASLVAINPEVMRSGPQISVDEPNGLIFPVTEEEIKLDLYSIEIGKAPDLDGYNAQFYKKAWCIVGKDVVDVILRFFTSSKFYKGINCTFVTLAPKVPNAFKVKDFRPNACCSVFYKILS